MPAPDTARVRELQAAIAAGRGLGRGIRALEQLVCDWAAELRRSGTPPTEGFKRAQAELREKRRLVELGRQAREELAAIDPMALRGLR